MPGLHAKKSPSGSKWWRTCPGGLAMVDSLPDDMRSGSGYAAKLGTVSHFLLETCLREGLSPHRYEGRLLQIVDEGSDDESVIMLKTVAKMPKSAAVRANTFEVDSDMVANVDLGFQYVVKRCDELGVPLSKVKLETRTNPVPDRDDTSGTADVTIDAWPIVLAVVDFKNGRLVVEHDDNPQLLAYLAGKAHDEGWFYDSYEVAVVQPNGRHTEGKVRVATVTEVDLRAFVVSHRAAAELADQASAAFPGWTVEPSREAGEAGRVQLNAFAADFDGDALMAPTWAEEYLVPGSNCDWCDAALVCPAYKAFRREQAQLEFTDEEDIPSAKDFRVTALDEARRIIERAPLLASMVRQAMRFATAEAKAGRKPAFMKFVRKVARREWLPAWAESTPDAVVKALLAGVKLDGVETGPLIGDNERAKLYVPEALVTGPQAEKLINSKLRPAFNAAFLHKPEKGLKLVLATAPGEEVAYKVGDDFTEEEGENE